MSGERLRENVMEFGRQSEQVYIIQELTTKLNDEIRD